MHTQLEAVTDTAETTTTPCVGISHPIGAVGHNPEQTASYTATAPCCGRTLNVCASRVLWWWTNGLIKCTRCNIEHLVETWTFEYIGDD